MIRSFLPTCFRARLGAACTVALLGLAALPLDQAKAVLANPATVVANDTYSIEMVAYASGDPANNFYAIQTNLTPTFGTTQTYPGDADLGQTLTVSSSETTAGGRTTDTINVSVPNSFVSESTNNGAVNNEIIDSIEFSIGNYNIPTGGTGDPLDFTTALTGATLSGTVTFTLNGVTRTTALNQTVMRTNANKSFSVKEDVTANTTTTPISDYNVSAFSLSVSYAAVPEPSTTGAVLLGAGSLLGLAVYRRRGARV